MRPWRRRNMNSPVRNWRSAKTPSPLPPASRTTTSPIIDRLRDDLVRRPPGERDVGDQGSIGLERPGRVVREVAGRPGEAAKDDGRSHHLLLAYHANER